MHLGGADAIVCKELAQGPYAVTVSDIPNGTNQQLRSINRT